MAENHDTVYLSNDLGDDWFLRHCRFGPQVFDILHTPLASSG